MPVAAGEIEEEDILDAMEDIALFAGNKYHRNASTTKQPLIFQMQQLTSGSPYSVPIEVTFIMDVDDLPESDDVYPYDDSWIFGQFYNDVTDVCNTQGVNLDAPDLFRRDLRENVTFRDKNESYYFKDYHIVCFSSASDDCDGFEIPDGLTADEHIQGNALLNPNDVTPGDNFLDYLLFSNYEGIANFHECLSDTEMNFHYESMEELAIAELPSPIGNNVIGQIEVGYNLSLGFYSRYSHNMLVMIAHKLPVSEGYEQADVLPCTECP